MKPPRRGFLKLLGLSQAIIAASPALALPAAPEVPAEKPPTTPPVPASEPKVDPWHGLAMSGTHCWGAEPLRFDIPCVYCGRSNHEPGNCVSCGAPVHRRHLLFKDHAVRRS
jgi:ribosomal protein L37E